MSIKHILSPLSRWLGLFSLGLVGSTALAQPRPEPIRLALIEGLSGPFANAGEAVHRNLVWAAERVNARGGVKLPGGARPLEIVRFDSKGNTEEALSMLRAAADQGVSFVLQGNSSATAAALVDAIGKHNEREPQRRALFLNYSAVDPVLTNEKCSFWHFRFDAHADMRLAALMDVLAADTKVQRVYLLGQDYSFGQHVVRKSREMIEARRKDLQIVGEELHPMGRIKDFLPYVTKIKASGAQAVVTGNWGNDLTLLIKAAREVGLDAKFYTFYGNALGVPAAIAEAGVGQVLAVAEWHPNAGGGRIGRLLRRFPAALPETGRRLRACAHAGPDRSAGRVHREGRQYRCAARGACDGGLPIRWRRAGRFPPGRDAGQRPPVHPAAVCEHHAAHGSARNALRQRGLGFRLQHRQAPGRRADRAAHHVPDGAPLKRGPCP